MSAETLRRPADPERVAYTAGLRALADLLEANPHLELPYTGRYGSINVILSGDGQRERLATWARAMPGAKRKSAGREGKDFYLDGRYHGVPITIIASREEVCEPVVVGTREITETVPDPELVAAVPTVTVTRTEEIVDWVCHPVLDDRSVP